MTTAQVVETSDTVNNNSPIQDYVHPDDQTLPTFGNDDRGGDGDGDYNDDYYSFRFSRGLKWLITV